MRHCTCTSVPVLSRARDCTYVLVLARGRDCTSVPILSRVRDCTCVTVLACVCECIFLYSCSICNCTRALYATIVGCSLSYTRSSLDSYLFLICTYGLYRKCSWAFTKMYLYFQCRADRTFGFHIFCRWGTETNLNYLSLISVEYGKA
jgi:hypothetical protein